VVRIVGPIHGVLYLLYLIAGADLSRRMGWPARELLWAILAGLVPFAAFVVERRATRRAEESRGPQIPSRRNISV
jgi:integral membrane protein